MAADITEQQKNALRKAPSKLYPGFYDDLKAAKASRAIKGLRKAAQFGPSPELASIIRLAKKQ